MKTVSHEELYEQVSSRPMTKVAADYGVTGTALKKACDRHRIPTPERGYWAKLEYGKPVNKEALPPQAEPNLALVRIAGSPEQHLSPSVREAKEKARDRLDKHAAANPPLVAVSEPTPSMVEPPSLAATRRAISKGRPDDQGFASARSKGDVPLKIAPASIERGIRALSQLFALAETQGHLPKAYWQASSSMQRLSANAGERTRNERAASATLKPGAGVRKRSTAARSGAWSLWMRSMSNWPNGTN